MIGKSKGAIIGLQGPPGTGKTSLTKNGLSKYLKDDGGESRPFAFLPIGGSVNGSTLLVIIIHMLDQRGRIVMY